MQEFLEIRGGKPLKGSIKVGGAKNAALPLFIASLLTSERCEFSGVPQLQDVDLTINLLEQLGSVVSYEGSAVCIETPSIESFEASYTLVKALRASFWVLGPLIARKGLAEVALPGGDAIGTRPVDIHLEALAKMGADIKLTHGVVHASARSGLHPAKIELRMPSVGATHQILMTAALVPGTTVINGAAREPEIVALCEMLSSMGATIEGAGSATLAITGKRELGGAKVKLLGDRIEAATYLLAGVATRGEVRVNGVAPKDLGSFIELLVEMGVKVASGIDWVMVNAESGAKGVRVSTAPFPGLATDIQAPLMAALATAEGRSVIEETIFEGRFTHVSELLRLGAKIETHDRIATVEGVQRLSGAPVEGHDIRGAASLVVAALGASGSTQIYEPHHLRRGYEKLEFKLSELGGFAGWKPEEIEDAIAIGC